MQNMFSPLNSMLFILTILIAGLVVSYQTEKWENTLQAENIENFDDLEARVDFCYRVFIS